ncbi:MAG TPA: aminoacyl-tRNA hydrolase [Candidatus Peribacteraceae bacterium]|nr:aminoacyl-tRNA hydrolase [Candidatus Peribacteraceae bacterium]
MKPELVIIGLGNPGKTYERTRHNLGFQAVEALAVEFGEAEWEEKQKFTSIVCEGRIVTAPLLLVKPLTFMNRSGEAIKKIVDFFKLDPAKQILVLCDDIDLPLGEVRVRMNGGPGTHNGLKSIVDIFGEDFPRIRIGLGEHPKGEELSNWVLSVPPKDQQKILKTALDGLPELVRRTILEHSA